MHNPATKFATVSMVSKLTTTLGITTIATIAIVTINEVANNTQFSPHGF